MPTGIFGDFLYFARKRGNTYQPAEKALKKCRISFAPIEKIIFWC